MKMSLQRKIPYGRYVWLVHRRRVGMFFHVPAFEKFPNAWLQMHNHPYM